jgi:hypothetical protein
MHLLFLNRSLLVFGRDRYVTARLIAFVLSSFLSDFDDLLSVINVSTRLREC